MARHNNRRLTGVPGGCFVLFCFFVFETTEIYFGSTMGPHRKLLRGPFSLNPPLIQNNKVSDEKEQIIDKPQ